MLGLPLREPQHPKPFTDCGAFGLGRGKLISEPALQRVGTKILLHDQPCLSADLQSRQPGAHELMQRVLANSDWRVRPDLGEAHIVGHVFWPQSSNVLQAKPSGIASQHIERALIHVDGPHHGIW